MSERSLAPATRPDPDPTQNPDPRYEYVTCPACGQRWQRIDWACTQHALSCSVDPLPSQPPLGLRDPAGYVGPQDLRPCFVLSRWDGRILQRDQAEIINRSGSIGLSVAAQRQILTDWICAIVRAGQPVPRQIRQLVSEAEAIDRQQHAICLRAGDAERILRDIAPLDEQEVAALVDLEQFRDEARQEAASAEPDHGGFSDPRTAACYYSPGVVR